MVIAEVVRQEAANSGISSVVGRFGKIFAVTDHLRAVLKQEATSSGLSSTVGRFGGLEQGAATSDLPDVAGQLGWRFISHIPDQGGGNLRPIDVVACNF